MAITAGVQGQSNLFWTGSAGGNWDVTGNWLTGVTPTSIDTALFTDSGTATVDITSTSATASALQGFRSSGAVSIGSSNSLGQLTLTASFSPNEYVLATLNDFSFESTLSVVLAGVPPVNLNAGIGRTITFNGSVNATNTVVLNGAGDIRINGNYTGMTLNSTNSNLYLGNSNTVIANVSMQNATMLQAEGAAPNTIGATTINGNLTMNGTSSVQAQLGLGNGNLTTISSSDTINVVGNVSFSATSTFDVVGSGFDSTVLGSYKLLGVTGAMNYGTNTITNGSTIVTYEYNGGFNATAGSGYNTEVEGIMAGLGSLGTFQNGDTFTLRRAANGDLILDYAPVPEPGTMLAIGAAVLGAGAALRRRFGRKTATSVEAEIV